MTTMAAQVQLQSSTGVHEIAELTNLLLDRRASQWVIATRDAGSALSINLLPGPSLLQQRLRRILLPRPP